MKYTTIILMLIPALLCHEVVDAQAQEYHFQREWDSVGVEIDNYGIPAAWTGGHSFTFPALCDLDGDGDKDCFLGQSSGPILYYQNCGNSNEAIFVLMDSMWQGIDVGYYSALEFCDFDHDDDFDLVVHSPAHLYENIGSITTPNFVLMDDSLLDNTGEYINGYHGTWVDIDADGDFDYFADNWEYGNISYYQNEGVSWNYSLQLITTNLLGIGLGYWTTPRFCDLDTDGDQDLFIGLENGNIIFYSNDGTPQQYSFALVSNQWFDIDVGDIAAPQFTDMNADGDYDLWIGRDAYNTNEPGDVFYYENIGTPQAPQMSFIRANNLTIDGGSGCGPVLVDNDQDGDLDLWYTNGTYLTLFNNVGSATSPAYSLFGENLLNGTPAYAIDLYDLDADGDQDLISSYGTAAYYGLIKFYQNVGTAQNPSFSFAFQIENTYFLLSQVALADMDADGDGDMLVGRYFGNLVYYENQGTPQSPDFVVQSENWQNIQGLSISLADMDLDGDFDLLNRNPVAGRVWLYENIGTPQSAQIVLADTNLYGLDLLAGQPEAGDLDGDGDMDILNGFFDGGMHFLRNITGEVSAPPPVQRHPRAGLQFSLGPNPANPFVAASFELRVASNMSLEVYDMLGRRVAELASGFHLPGEYRYVWDAGQVAAGMYIVRLKTPQENLSEKLTIIK